MKRLLLTFSILFTLSTYGRSQSPGALAMNNLSKASADEAMAFTSSQDQDDAPVMSFYPNPVKDFINIRFKDRGDYTVRIYNVVAAKIKEKVLSDDNSLKLDLSELPKGMYFLSYELPGTGKVYTKTFTKD